MGYKCLLPVGGKTIIDWIVGDTLFDADIQSLANATENVLYTYKVQDPRRFGVAVTNGNGQIERLVEKPQEFVSDEAIVGIYYIKDVKQPKKALQHLIGNDIRTRGEFQLTDALQMMIEQGCINPSSTTSATSSATTSP